MSWLRNHLKQTPVEQMGSSQGDKDDQDGARGSSVTTDDPPEDVVYKWSRGRLRGKGKKTTSEEH